MEKLHYTFLNQKLKTLGKFYFEIRLHYSFHSNKTTNVNLLNGLVLPLSSVSLLHIYNTSYKKKYVNLIEVNLPNR